MLEKPKEDKSSPRWLNTLAPKSKEIPENLL